MQFITVSTLQWDMKLIARMQLHYTMYPMPWSTLQLLQVWYYDKHDQLRQVIYLANFATERPWLMRNLAQLGCSWEYGNRNTSLHSMSGWAWDETYWEKRMYMIHLQQADKFLLHGEYNSYQVQRHCGVQDMGSWVVAKFPSDGVTRECNNIPQAPARTPQISR